MKYAMPLVLCLLFLAACAGNETPASAPRIGAGNATATSRFTDPVLQEAEVNYNRYCAHCHGYAGEGQLESTIANTESLGMHTVPPHDSTGHTWRHPDWLLFMVTRDGIDNPLDHYPMSGFSFALTDEQIWGVIQYIKTFWTDEQREYQAQITADNPPPASFAYRHIIAPNTEATADAMPEVETSDED